MKFRDKDCAIMDSSQFLKSVYAIRLIQEQSAFYNFDFLSWIIEIFYQFFKISINTHYN